MRLLLAAVAVGAAMAGCTSEPESTGPPTALSRAGDLHVDNVILISIDSLRADHLGVYGYRRPTSPTLDALAASGLVFDRAYSTTSWTLPAHTAMFTGLDDRAHGVRHHKTKVAAEIPILAEELAEHGVNTIGFYSGPYLHPTFGLGRGFEQYWNSSSVLPKDANRAVGLTHYASLKDVTNPIILANVRKWLAGGGPIGERNFIFIHMWDVHYAYIPPERYLQIFDPDYEGSIDGTVFHNKAVRDGMPPRDLEHLIARYDGEIRYTDDTVREILDLLEAKGLLASAAVIVVADHGDEFFEHHGKGHHRTLFEEVLHVPLIIHIPGRAPTQPRIDKIVSLIDIYPTACGLLDVPCQQLGNASESLVEFFTKGNAFASRNDALADLTVPELLFRHDGIVTPEGKVVRWFNTADHTLRLVRDDLPDQPLPPTAALGDEPTLFFSPSNLVDEQHGEFVKPGAAGETIARVVERLHRRANEADQLHDRLVPSTADNTTVIDEQTKQRLRALGYMK